MKDAKIFADITLQCTLLVLVVQLFILIFHFRLNMMKCETKAINYPNYLKKMTNCHHLVRIVKNNI